MHGPFGPRVDSNSVRPGRDHSMSALHLKEAPVKQDGFETFRRCRLCTALRAPSRHELYLARPRPAGGPGRQSMLTSVGPGPGQLGGRGTNRCQPLSSPAPANWGAGAPTSICRDWHCSGRQTKQNPDRDSIVFILIMHMSFLTIPIFGNADRDRDCAHVIFGIIYYCKLQFNL